MLGKKLRSPRFWAALGGAVMILLQAFGIKIPAPAVNEILGAVSAVLVMFGFIEPPGDGEDPDNKESPGSGEQKD